MNNLVPTIVLILLSALVLYLNLWWLIAVFAFAYGLVSHRGWWFTTLSSLLAVFLVWAILLYVRDASFFRSPAELFGAVVGDLPGWCVPLVGGLLGGIVAMLSSGAGHLLMRSPQHK